MYRVFLVLTSVSFLLGCATGTIQGMANGMLVAAAFCFLGLVASE